MENTMMNAQNPKGSCCGLYEGYLHMSIAEAESIYNDFRSKLLQHNPEYVKLLNLPENINDCEPKILIDNINTLLKIDKSNITINIVPIKRAVLDYFYYKKELENYENQ